MIAGFLVFVVVGLMDLCMNVSWEWTLLYYGLRVFRNLERERKEKGVVSERKKQEGSSSVKKLKRGVLVGKIGGLLARHRQFGDLTSFTISKTTTTNPALNFSHNSSEFHPVLGSDDNFSEFYYDADNDKEYGDGYDGSG
ncbi:hypothetical protein Pyn_15309 [Prunus yedoensis var. nudiflora]|uniref:Uncharacterized protein n=1 Tax=Prunus yedoensis var. nudiflora TaxID=2094558 RepID=A0A314ZBR6_PRUYE|nr:hypothetical protein Pyn_15309 [Prunus yedoensis var. nudiflora]